ncbi:hypothetical protein TcCL_NonESM12590 [Trypanosoma cruzi]|nr:hypothetical protein TcCL_NonESM12590 [Trypanosoma cruzi]
MNLSVCRCMSVGQISSEASGMRSARNPSCIPFCFWLPCHIFGNVVPCRAWVRVCFYFHAHGEEPEASQRQYRRTCVCFHGGMSLCIKTKAWLFKAFVAV